MKQHILVVDDEADIVSSLTDLLEDEDYHVRSAGSGEEALRIVSAANADEIDAALLDIWMPGIDGMETLRQIKCRLPNLPVIMLSGHGTIETALRAVENGAFHFLEKPFSEEFLLVTLRNALHLASLQQENTQLRKGTPSAKVEVIGHSTAFIKLLQEVERAASSDAWVLIHGENGTGKELIANMIHQKSARAAHPFVEVNCAAIPEELIESELLGHEKGAFTGATSRRNGRFAQAHRGTLFLDEVADMSLKTQAKILRVLQEQRFQRVGGADMIEVNVRIVAASNKLLEEQIAQGNFRTDLYYRLNVVPITALALRERKEDIEPLAKHFLRMVVKTHGGRPKTMTPAVYQALTQHHWPGNVRELKNTIERLVIMSTGDPIDTPDLPLHLQTATLGASTQTSQQAVAKQNSPAGAGLGLEADQQRWFQMPYREAKEAFEEAYLKQRLAQTEWNISKTAAEIALERSNLHKKIRRYHLEE